MSLKLATEAANMILTADDMIKIDPLRGEEKSYLWLQTVKETMERPQAIMQNLHSTCYARVNSGMLLKDRLNLTVKAVPVCGHLIKTLSAKSILYKAVLDQKCQRTRNQRNHEQPSRLSFSSSACQP